MATTGIMNGTLLGVYFGSTLLAHSTECSISLGMDPRDITTKDSGGDQEIAPGLRNASISFSALHAEDAAYGVSDLMTLYNAGTSVAVKFSTEVSGDGYFSGTALITSLEISAGMEDNVSYSGTLQISGGVTYDTVA